MLYSKEKTGFKKRSYEYLHNHSSTEETPKRRFSGRTMLNGTPKK